MKILIPGGAGFIGSTVASALLDAGHTPIILDNFVTGRRDFCAGRITYEGDCGDRRILTRIFRDHPEIQSVIHCAALIVIGESVDRPLHYYRENVSKTLELVDGLLGLGCKRLVFSSSASIYGPSTELTVDEDSPLLPASPYARSKAMVETMLADIVQSEDLRVVSLRYFNPIGADPWLRTGLQLSSPSHALGRLISAHRDGHPFTVSGTDYPTRDGSGVRDYVHVWDLARAHVTAIERFDSLFQDHEPGLLPINLGTRQGTTVFELVTAFDEAVGGALKIRSGPRRPGDVAGAYTRSRRASDLLDWHPQYSIKEAIAHSLAWSARLSTLDPLQETRDDAHALVHGR